MTNSELNKYIKHYLINDKTQRAIMLTADWGTGKTHYVQNVLIPYLSKNKHKCIAVSLYGLKDLSELCKSIYLEVRCKPINKKSEKGCAGQIFAKTIVKGVVSYFGIDLRIGEKYLSKLYSSIDLSNKLIILEDIERSKIDIIELLGFVNNLVEQDGVKVLLIANEQEIVHYEDSTETDKSDKKDESGNPNAEYFKIKEKTVSDTIQFYCDYECAISNIIKRYNKPKLIFKDDIIKDINDIMTKLKNHNLRSLIFACQKTVDLFCNVDLKGDVEFFKEVFLSIFAFTLKSKAGAIEEWGKLHKSSYEMGTDSCPLHKFSYDFIRWQKVDKEEILSAEKAFISNKEFEKNQKTINQDLEIIFSYTRCSENDVSNAIKNLCETLGNPDVNFYNEYGKIANYLISSKKVVDCDDDIAKCLELLKSNLRSSKEDFNEYQIFTGGTVLKSNEEQAQFSQFKKDVLQIINDKKTILLNLDNVIYSKDNVEKLCEKIYSNKNKYLTQGFFIKGIDINKFIILLKKCSAGDIERLRGAIMSIYRSSNINEFLSADKQDIGLLIAEIEKIKDDSCFDKIQKLQLSYFISNLKEIEKNL